MTTRKEALEVLKADGLSDRQARIEFDRLLAHFKSGGASEQYAEECVVRSIMEGLDSAL